jgi:hypothetical protein
MQPFKRLLYLLYYIKNTDFSLYYKFLTYAANSTKKSKLRLISDSIYSVFKYNISLLEYFQFRFFEQDSINRNKWAGTGFMYEYQLKMNPIATRVILDNKTLFYQNYKPYFIHHVYSLNEIKDDLNIWNKLILDNKKIVLKTKDGKCGKGVLIKTINEFENQQNLITFMEENEFDLIEEFINQHYLLNQLSPSAVNTVRIFTQLTQNNEVTILGCRLRISVNSFVDNMAAGNMSAPIDEITGKINGVGVYSDITKIDEMFHPVTKTKIIDFEVPFWPEIIDLVKNAAILHPENKSIGWDIVITENGPGILEGNHDWCKLVWQLPVKEGMKVILENYN